MILKFPKKNPLTVEEKKTGKRRELKNKLKEISNENYLDIINGFEIRTQSNALPNPSETDEELLKTKATEMTEDAPSTDINIPTTQEEEEPEEDSKPKFHEPLKMGDVRQLTNGLSSFPKPTSISFLLLFIILILFTVKPVTTKDGQQTTRMVLILQTLLGRTSLADGSTSDFVANPTDSTPITQVNPTEIPSYLYGMGYGLGGAYMQ